jgi:ankyrin repeat protein
MLLLPLSILLLGLLPPGAGAAAAHSPDFHAAARHDDVNRLKALHLTLADIDAVDEEGQTALMAACLSGAAQSVRLLLSPTFGADPAVGEMEGYLPMDGAAFGGHPDVVVALLEAGLAADTPHEHDQLTPLWRTTWLDGEAGQSHHYEAAARLIEQGGADPNYLLPEGVHDHVGEAHTPLQSAVVHGQTEMLRLFLESMPAGEGGNGDDGSSMADGGSMTDAAGKAHRSIATRAEAVNLAPPPHKWSSLHLAMAALSDNSADREVTAAIVAELIVAGGDLAQENAVGKTPLEMAEEAVGKGREGPSTFPTTAAAWVEKLTGAGMPPPASLMAAAAAEASGEAEAAKKEKKRRRRRRQLEEEEDKKGKGKREKKKKKKKKKKKRRKKKKAKKNKKKQTEL